jgi:ribosome biogenesis GTPase A
MTGQLQTPDVSRPANAKASDLVRALDQLALVLKSSLEGRSTLLGRLSALRTRLSLDRLQLAVLGQFKRGKSTFINALLGASLLPTGVIPLTAVPTFITWRRAPRITIRFNNGTAPEEFEVQDADENRKILFRFVAEEANPENRLAVERVDLFYPSDILADGTVIIDTPGVGSTLQHNTETALQILPECDAAFFIISADPPMTEIELNYLRRVKSKTTRVFFVLNKVDYLQPDEASSAVEFLKAALRKESLIDADERVFCISARNGLEAKRNGDRSALEASGMGELEERVMCVLAHNKKGLLEDGVRNKARDIGEQAAAELSLRRRALSMTIEELTAHADVFWEVLRSIEEQRRVTRDVLAGDHLRLRDALEIQIDLVRRQITGHIATVIDATLSCSAPAVWEIELRSALAKAVQKEFEQARNSVASAFSADTESVVRAHKERIEALILRVRQAAAEIFNISLVF